MGGSEKGQRGAPWRRSGRRGRATSSARARAVDRLEREVVETSDVLLQKCQRERCARESECHCEQCQGLIAGSHQSSLHVVSGFNHALWRRWKAAHSSNPRKARGRATAGEAQQGSQNGKFRERGRGDRPRCPLEGVCSTHPTREASAAWMICIFVAAPVFSFFLTADFLFYLLKCKFPFF
jgi:hypothetical protein